MKHASSVDYLQGDVGGGGETTLEKARAKISFSSKSLTKLEK